MVVRLRLRVRMPVGPMRHLVRRSDLVAFPAGRPDPGERVGPPTSAFGPSRHLVRRSGLGTFGGEADIARILQIGR